MGTEAMVHPVKNQIGGIFIPVSNLEISRDWYSKVLGLVPSSDILHGHLYVLPMDGSPNVVLDSKIYRPENVYKTPAFHFNTDNISRAYLFMKSMGVELLTEIQHD